MKKLLFLLLLTVWLIGCTQSESPTPTITASPFPTSVSQLPPTFTALPPSERLFPTYPVVTVTQRPLPEKETSTPVAFDETSVELRYIIPSLNLDRRLEGSVNSHIIIVDEALGQAVQRANQGPVLLDIQRILSDLLLPVVPDGCEGCVYISYRLPFSNLEGEGWLRDPVVLASIENYTAVAVGPHFPPNTIAGIRRSASPYAPAHTLAVTADGLAYVWLANESEVSPPTAVDPDLLQMIQAINLDGLAYEYSTPCTGSSLESFYLKPAQQAEIIGIVCPEYTLPIRLMPLYARLDQIISQKLAQDSSVLPKPPTVFPLTAVLDYDRLDGSRLTLHYDGTAVARNSVGDIITSTSAISTSQIISLTTDLIAEGTVRTGLSIFQLDNRGELTPVPPRTTLLVRGPVGVYDAQWLNGFDQPELLLLNELLAQITGEPFAPAATAVATPTLETDSTAESPPETETAGAPTPESTVTEEATAPPTVSATPTP